MERIVVVVYKPLEGKEDTLRELLRKHHGILLEEGLVTKRTPVIMKNDEGYFLEVFGWSSADSIEKAHSNQRVQSLWQEFGAACTYETPVSVSEFGNLFSEFTPVDF